MKTYTTTEAAAELTLDVSRILQLCRGGRLGYTLPKHGQAWIVTEQEIARFRAIGPGKSGRPKKRKTKKA